MTRYECPECGAEYAVIEIAVRVDTSPIINCLHCGHALPDDEGPKLVQYTLLKRPNPDTLDDLYPPPLRNRIAE
jgi:DNA-directed RNA polymerase subunit RPC12/RpoP